ncbi:MAG: 2-amino-4-hydroxy-6-hydroxymethyldihydropteridine diphosphokinase [Muribaculaceae bacterium]
MNNAVVLSIGSNSVDREAQMTNCIAWLRGIATLSKLSSVYDSPASNGKDPDYLNAVAEITTTLTHPELNKLLKDYERQCGRTPQSKSLGSIPIDIDIVMWNGEVLRPKDFAQYYFAKGWNEINK